MLFSPFVSILLKILDHQKKKGKLIIAPLLVILGIFLLYNQNVNYNNPFLFDIPFDKDEEIAELLKGEDVMVFSSEMRDFYSMIIPLRFVNSFYFIECDDLKDMECDIPENGFYVMVDKDSFIDEVN